MRLFFITKAILNRWELLRIKKAVINSHHDVSAIDKAKIADKRRKGFSLSESALYNLKSNDYNEYISTWESYQPRISNSPYFVLSDDKYLFSLVFKNFVNTPEVYALICSGKVIPVYFGELNNENLYSKFISNGGGVIKDRGGCDGFKVYVFDVNGENLIYKNKVVDKKEFDNIVSAFADGIVQEKVVQGEFENNIFNKSINTIRMITVKKKDSNEHEIIGALQRIGTKRSMPVDNFNQGGGSALIDIETGKLGSMTCIDSFNENGERIFYDNHPDTGARIKGVVIPRWDYIKETIKETTKKLPFFDYIAWDIVLRDDDIAIIETNMKSSLNVFQVHGGLRNDFLGLKYQEKGYMK